MKNTYIYFDYFGIFDKGFGYGVGSDSPNEIMAERVTQNVINGKPFRMRVIAIEDIPENLY